MFVMGEAPSEDRLIIKVANYGEINFTVAIVGILIGRHSGALIIPLPEGSVKLPHELTPENTCNFWTDYKKLLPLIEKKTRRGRIKIRVYVCDYVGRKYTSKSHWYIVRKTWHYKLRLKVVKLYRSCAKLIVP